MTDPLTDTGFYNPSKFDTERMLIGFSKPGTLVDNKGQIERIQRVRDAYHGMAELLVHACPNSFELDNALARLRESMFWATNSVCHE